MTEHEIDNIINNLRKRAKSSSHPSDSIKLTQAADTILFLQGKLSAYQEFLKEDTPQTMARLYSKTIRNR